MKLIVFDLDDTIAPVGKGVSESNAERIRLLEKKGNRIALCSGKPVFYLCGFVRQLGLKDPILLGENGAVIQFGIGLPPEVYYVQPFTEDAHAAIRRVENDLKSMLPGLWFQPNIAGLTPFPKSDKEFDRIAAYLEEHRQELQEVDIYRHVDSFDIVPKGISKKKGLQTLGIILGITSSEMVCVGNGVNDYPMFEYAETALGVNVPDPQVVKINFPDIDEALEWLFDHL